MTPERGSALYRRLLSYVLPHGAIFGLALIGLAVVAATEMGFAAWLRPMIDALFVEPDRERARLIPLLLIALFLVRGIASFTANYGMTLVGRRVVLALRAALFEQLLRLPAAFYDRNASGPLVSRITYDVEQVAQASTNAVTILVRDTLTVVFLLGYMFWLSPPLAALFLVVGPVVGLLVRLISDRFRAVSRRIQDNMGELTQLTRETVDGQRMVKAFGGQAQEAQRFGKANRKNFQLQMKRAATSAASVPVVQLVAATSLAGVILLASQESVLVRVRVSDFMSFIAAMLLLMPPLKRLTRVTNSIQTGIAAAESLFGLLDRPRERDSGNQRIGRARGQLAYHQVSFRYPRDSEPVLEDISFSVEPGETVALVGRSGTGKTTLVHLLTRFYDPDRGQVCLDGRDVRDYRLEDLRRQIALVGQDALLFHDSIRANIAYGDQAGASDAAIREAARAAHALTFIEELPQGFDTSVGEGGGLLSGGQRQRIAIARALLKDAPVLVLDEATSSLDAESERAIQAALETLMQGRTTLVIAHRLSTVERADRILVLDRGRIAETGTHRELLSRDGEYAGLYRLQFGDPAVA